MPTEIEQQSIENEDNNTSTTDELLDLKKKLADEVVDKLLEKDSGLFSYLLKGSISDYLVDEKTVEDAIHDEVLIGGLGKSAGILSPELKKYREMFSQAKTKNDLEALRTKIFNKISGNEQDSTNTPEQTNSPTTTTQATPTTSTTSTTGATTTTTDSSSTTEKAKVDTSSQSYEIDHFNIAVSPETKNIWDNLKGKEKPDLEPFACALKVFNILKKEKILKNEKYITVVDFTKKKGKKRFFVINMDNNTVEYAEKVGHGKKSGGDYATHFSNKHGSNQSSLGAYLTPDAITKSPKKGRYGLRQVKGLEPSNEQSDERGIAIHEGGENGSQGCFTLPKKNSKEIMNKIKGGSLVFAYAKSKEYFAQSNYFQQNPDGRIAA